MGPAAWTLLVVGASGLGTGVLGAILGTGGGVFLIPILVLGLGVPMHHAVATSILSVVATSSAVASTNVERGTANMRLGMTLEVATTLGAISGALTVTAHWLSPRMLEAVFALVLLPTAVLMALGRTETDAGADGAKSGPEAAPADAPGALGGVYVDEAEGRPVIYRVRRLWAGLGISFVAGNLS